MSPRSSSRRQGRPLGEGLEVWTEATWPAPASPSFILSFLPFCFTPEGERHSQSSPAVRPAPPLQSWPHSFRVVPPSGSAQGSTRTERSSLQGQAEC